MTQQGETEGFDAAAHIRTVMDAAGGALDVAVLHDGQLDPPAVQRYALQGQVPVSIDEDAIAALDVRIVRHNLAAHGDVVRHSTDALASAVAELLKSSYREASGLRHLQPTRRSA